MATKSMVLQLVVVLTVVAMTTVSGKTFRLATIRKQGSQPAYFRTVLNRVDQLSAQVTELQADLEDMHETIKIINATVNPPVVSQLATLSQSCRTSYCNRLKNLLIDQYYQP